MSSLKDIKRKDLVQAGGYINGKWITKSSDGKATFDVVNPANLEKLTTLPEMTAKDTDDAIAAAHTAFATYKKTSARERARMMRKWNDLILANVDDLALILMLENGKTLAEAKGEVVYAASCSFLTDSVSEVEGQLGRARGMCLGETKTCSSHG